MSSQDGGSGLSGGATVPLIIIGVVILMKVIVAILTYIERAQAENGNVLPESRFLTVTMDKFLNEMEREKPIRFSAHQLRIATNNFSDLLGSGGFGAVYKGIFTDRTPVAVKVLNGSSDKRIEEQFMAEVSTIGRTHHLNLVRLYGFCFDRDLKALVYEYMVNGSLDRFLFQENKVLEFDKLYEISVGTAKGIAYLHEECQQRIIHYDIKPGNILLDVSLTPKVADFGLAKLCNRDHTHVSMTGGRGTPGYAAPELWLPFPITHKCDVYSFGMLLFEIIGRRRNLDISLSQSQEWFPRWVWNKFEKGSLIDLFELCGIEEMSTEKSERMMVKVALWCVQYRPQSRPWMSVVVKMLEGVVEVPTPIDPFQHLAAGTPHPDPPDDLMIWTQSEMDSASSQIHSNSSYSRSTSVTRKDEIEIAS